MSKPYNEDKITQEFKNLVDNRPDVHVQEIINYWLKVLDAELEREQNESLDALIEKCGRRFLSLVRYNAKGEWSCDGTLEDDETVYGKTPQEAVKNLLIALESKEK